MSSFRNHARPSILLKMKRSSLTKKKGTNSKKVKQQRRVSEVGKLLKNTNIISKPENSPYGLRRKKKIHYYEDASDF